MQYRRRHRVRLPGVGGKEKALGQRNGGHAIAFTLDLGSTVQNLLYYLSM